MPSPRKSQRPRRNSQIKDDITERLDDSSPSRPAKRRKHAEAPPAEIPEEDTSSLLADSSAVCPTDDSQLVAKVTEHLNSADVPVRASQVHANSIHEENNEGVQAYAKIAGRDWTFYVTKLVVNIGRTPEPAPKLPPGYDPELDPSYLHIDLGPAKMVSRQHAQISFHAASEKWYLHVKGRNGVKVNHVQWRMGHSDALQSGDVIEVGTIEMMFVLPLESHAIQIDDEYLQRAGITRPETAPANNASRAQRSTTPLGGGADLTPRGDRSTLSRGQPTPQAIAPAPPDYRRPGTPPSVRSRVSVPGSQLRSPSSFKGSPSMMMQNDVDLSLDENKNLKPQFSYAQMITQAIMQTSEEKLNLAGIYNYIMENYSYYRHQAAAGWQNSIRHNLSLNKAFEKVARATEEPGKGMKWYILPEYKEELVRVAYRGGRGGHRGSSNPSSPNQLSYVNQGPRDLAARDAGSARKRRVSPSGSPQPRSSLRDLHMTPDRSSRRLLPIEAPASSDGSPLPRYRKSAAANKSTATGTSSASTAAAANDASASSTAGEATPRSPTLTSAYLQDDISSSFVTPAPHRVELKLNPPSTLQRPSQHMPTSSPAPFWKYAEIGSTPLHPATYDYSPSKALGLSSGPSTTVMPASSSPPPVKRSGSKSPVSSPTRPARSINDTPKQPPRNDIPGTATTEIAPPTPAAAPTHMPAAVPAPAAVPNEVEEDAGFDLTKGFQSIGSYHAPVQHGLPVPKAMNTNR